jgi:uncharacterized coiled-coil protein SlyX
MNNLNEMKIKLEMQKVATIKAEMEYKIAERMRDIDRLNNNIIIQDKRVEELKKELRELQEKSK